MTTLSFVIATHKRPYDASECIESILGQTYGDLKVVVVTSPVGDTTSILESRFDDPRISIVEESERGGPASACNVAFANATGDVIVRVDDDVVFASDSAAERIAAEFDSNPDLGILAFRIVDYETGQVHREEIPVGPDGHQPDERHPTTYFVGAGAAFRAEAFTETQGYPEAFSYQMEELDLSFQILDQGYEAVYEPGIVVRHKRSSPGRPEDHRRWQLTLENRIRVAIRHLPLRYIFSSVLVWTPYVLYRTGGSVRTVVTAYRNLLRDLGTLRDQRNVISSTTRRRVKEHGGRLWF